MLTETDRLLMEIGPNSSHRNVLFLKLVPLCKCPERVYPRLIKRKGVGPSGRKGEAERDLDGLGHI